MDQFIFAGNGPVVKIQHVEVARCPLIVSLSAINEKIIELAIELGVGWIDIFKQ